MVSLFVVKGSKDVVYLSGPAHFQHNDDGTLNVLVSHDPWKPFGAVWVVESETVIRDTGVDGSIYHRD